MYNIYTHLRRINHQHTAQENIVKESYLREKRIQDRKVLSNSYQERLYKFVKDMSVKPQKQPDEYNPKVTAAKASERNFRFKTFRTEMDRIAESMKNTERCDTTPAPKNALRLRPRNKQQEIGPAFHCKPTSELERVMQVIQGSNRGISTRKLKATKSLGKIALEQTVDESEENVPKIPVRDIRRVQLYNIFFKAPKRTHFKSAASLSVRSILCLVVIEVEVSENATRRGSEDPEYIKLTQDKSEYQQLANNMLKECNLIRRKHCRSMIRLRQGGGKLMQTHGDQFACSSIRGYSVLVKH